MQKYKGWYFPDKEEYFINLLKDVDGDKIKYQHLQRKNSFKYLDNNRNALDIGANVGLWSKDMCKKFDHVFLFEPYTDNIECLKANLNEFTNYKIYECALSNEKSIENFFIDEQNIGSSSFTQMKSEIENLKLVSVQKILLDELNIENVDYIKIDVQFHELEVIEGSVDTLNRNNPVLCIEAARRNNKELLYVKKFVQILENLKYKIVGGFGKELYFKK